MIQPAAILASLAPLLNAASVADLAPFWTSAELADWISLAAKRLGGVAAAFVERDTLAITLEDAAVQLPARSVAVLHASVAGTTLRLSTVAEIEALDDAWSATEDYPTKYMLDVLGQATLTLYPSPTNPGELATVCQVFPDFTLTDVEAPSVAADYCMHRALAAARRKQGDAAMPEVAAWADARAALYEQALAQLYGVRTK